MHVQPCTQTVGCSADAARHPVECGQNRVCVFSQLVSALLCCGQRACVWSCWGSAAQNHFHLNISAVLDANHRWYPRHWRQHRKFALCVTARAYYVHRACMQRCLNVRFSHRWSSDILAKEICLVHNGEQSWSSMSADGYVWTSGPL